jgi:hypothetical protein
MALFAKDKKTGELAVKKAYALLKKAGYKPRLPIEIQKDHDIILGDGRKVEVKFDVVMDTTGNLGVEWWSDRIKEVEGWGKYCNADILIQFYNMDNAVVINWHKFRNWMLDNIHEFEQKDSKYSNADVILVPMESIPEEVKEQDIGRLFYVDYEIEPWELDGIHGIKRTIEPAKSNRSTCTFCGKTIPKGELRIKDKGKWCHLKCAVKQKLVTIGSLERLIGFEKLTEWQIEHIRSVLEQYGERN